MDTLLLIHQPLKGCTGDLDQCDHIRQSCTVNSCMSANISCTTCISEPSPQCDEPDPQQQRLERWGWRRRTVCPGCSGTADPPPSDEWGESLLYECGTPVKSQQKKIKHEHFCPVVSQKSWTDFWLFLLFWEHLFIYYHNVIHPWPRLHTFFHVLVQFLHLRLHFADKLRAALKSSNRLHCREVAC